MSWFPRLSRAACIVALLLGAATLAYPAMAAGESTGAKADLDAVESRLRAAEAALTKAEKSRGIAEKALAAAEKSVSRSKRRMRELVQQRKQAESELSAIRTKLSETQAQIDLGRTALGLWLRRYYQYGGEPGVGQLLSAREPNQMARDALYLERIGRQKQAIVARLRSAEALQAEQAREAQARAEQVKQLEANHARETAKLKKVQARRARILARLTTQVKTQRQQVNALRRDEATLRSVIERIEQTATLRRARSRWMNNDALVVGGDGVRSGRGKAFGNLRGVLDAPVPGTVTGRFGAERSATGTPWQGVFIRSASGREVRAVADGQVVYSDWMRGFGNLVIIDHGDNYLTVYGNNEALFKSTGERVAGGDVVAAVGDSGGNPESGLYFEIRHNGRPLDPLEWIRLK